MSKPRFFTLHRMDDETGVSGTGVVAWGVEWPDKSVSMRWMGATPSFVNYEGVSPTQLDRKGTEHAQIVHGHKGKTIMNWSDNDRNKDGTKEGPGS